MTSFFILHEKSWGSDMKDENTSTGAFKIIVDWRLEKLVIFPVFQCKWQPCSQSISNMKRNFRKSRILNVAYIVSGTESRLLPLGKSFAGVSFTWSCPVKKIFMLSIDFNGSAFQYIQVVYSVFVTRKHSSRMRTVCCSGRRGR